jgi:hypothetical protein
VEKFGRDRQVRDDNKTRRMRISCWITKAINILSEYIILVAFPLQKWLRERASIFTLYVHSLLLLTLAEVGAAWPAKRAQFVE